MTWSDPRRKDRVARLAAHPASNSCEVDSLKVQDPRPATGPTSVVPNCAAWPSTVGSRRAATGARRDPKTCRQTVTDHDRRFHPARPSHLGFLIGSHGPQCLGILPGKCSVGSDTEGAGGSNPVAPTTVLAGQRAVSTSRAALPTSRGRAAAAVCSLLNRMGLPEPDDTGPTPAQRPRSVVTTPVQPMVRRHTGQPAHHAPAGGLVRGLLLPCSPANRPAAWRWTRPLVGQAASAAPSLCVRCRGPGRPSTATHQPGAPTVACPAAPTRSGSGAVRTVRMRTGRGYQTPARPDTWIAPVAWTPDAWTPAGPVDDVRTRTER